MKLADLDVLRADPVPAAGEALDALDVQHVRADPLICAPSETRKRQRSWTCGSQAAFEIIVSPGRERRGHDGVLGRHHARLVEEDLARRASRRRGARSARATRDLGAELARTHGCACRAGGARSRRRPAAARSRGRARASSGPASRNDARIRLGELLVDLVVVTSGGVHANLVRARSTRRRRRARRAARASCRRRGSAARS